MFTLPLQSSILRTALAASGRRREDLAEACNVSLRAVHRWLASEDLSAHRDMNSILLAEVLVWLQDPDFIQISLPRSLTGERELRAARDRHRALIDKAMDWKNSHPGSLRTEFITSQARLAGAKVAAMELFQGMDGVISSVVQVSGPEVDPLFTIIAIR